MTRVYVAGPMRGVPDFNFPAFFAAADRFRAAGWDVVNPAAEDVFLDGFDPATSQPLAHEHYMRRDLPLVAACDAIALLPGWERSRGATAELVVAQQCGLAVLDAETLEPVAERPGTSAYLGLLDAMADLHRRKAAGYSGGAADVWANFREAEAWGSTALEGCLIRMGDKYRRSQNLVRDPANDQVGEALRDTLVDLAAYALIAVCLLEETR